MRTRATAEDIGSFFGDIFILGAAVCGSAITGTLAAMLVIEGWL